MEQGNLQIEIDFKNIYLVFLPIFTNHKPYKESGQ